MKKKNGGRELSEEEYRPTRESGGGMLSKKKGENWNF